MKFLKNLFKKKTEEPIFDGKSEFEIKDHVLLFKGERINLPKSISSFSFLKEFILNNSVSQILPCDEIFIILLKPRSCKDNVCAIDKTGNILWRIKPVPYDPPAYQLIRMGNKPGTFTVLEGRGCFEVDCLTGEVGKMLYGPRD